MGRAEKQGLAMAAGVSALLAIRALRTTRPYSFNGKSVMVTGGSRGLGLVLARQLAGEGARLTLIARDDSELLRAAEDIRARHPAAEVLLIQGDVRERDEVERAVAQAAGHYGGIDVLINNAGIIEVGPLDHMALADYDTAMKSHFWGPLFMVLAVVPHMRRDGGGRIVNISSVGGRIAVPHMLPYSASKFALTGLSDGLRAELARDNIVVTTVCPGLMRIGSAVNATFKGQRDREYAWFAVSSSLPVIAIGAERAARQILDACRSGKAELVITIQAKLAILARTVAPELFGRAMSFVNRLLPRPVDARGHFARRRRTAMSSWAQDRLLAPMYATARRNNEL